MCCIFKCLIWCLDFLQQVWTFLMSACIIATLCCLFITISIAGAFMGYNYSISELIDTKETNISIYVKRGVFEQDPSLENDLTWRRSGNEPANAITMTQAPVQQSLTAPPMLRQQGPAQSVISRRAGQLLSRKIEDSIFETNDRHKFEGSLVKLTRKSGDYATINVATHTHGTRIEDLNHEDINQVLGEININSVEYLKDLQSLINKKRIDAIIRNQQNTLTTTYFPVEKLDSGFNGDRGQVVSLGDRRMMVSSQNYSTLIEVEKMRSDIPKLPTRGESLREYVPGQGIGDPAKWFLPKVPPAVLSELMRLEYKDEEAALNARPTFPIPVTPRRGPLKPSRHRSTVLTKTLTSIQAQTTREKKYDLEKLFANRGLFENPKMFEKIHQNIHDMKKIEKDYYDDDMKGLPVRRRRNVDPYKLFVFSTI